MTLHELFWSASKSFEIWVQEHCYSAQCLQHYTFVFGRILNRYQLPEQSIVSFNAERNLWF